MKKILAVCMSLVMLLSVAVPAFASTDTLSEDIVILYTNDVHTYIDGSLSYDVIASVKDELQKEYKYVILADAGDHIQGTAYGSMDKGETIIHLMNAAEYDIATLGNHEFDYNMSGCLNVIDLAEFPYVSANFYHEKDGIRGENVLDSYVMFDCGEEKLAIIGITTPETFSKSTPAYFQDEDGNFVYGISGGDDGSLLQQDVQKAINLAKQAGATKVVALGHLGIDTSSQPWTSTETIGAVCGLDAFIDGHSHSVVEGDIVKDKDGHDVVLTQTGNYFDRIGMMVIDGETDKITTDFIECEEILDTDGKSVVGYKLVSELYSGTDVISDSSVKNIKETWIAEVDKKLGEKIGTSEVILDNYDPEGNRLVRSQETNSGDFAADALYYLFDNMDMDVDVAVTNGGGIRNTALTGDITYKVCKNMHTFGNVACLQTVSGQQLLDALEWGARFAGVGESGGFLQVSGITYKVDTSVANTTKENDMGTWVAGPDTYRVYDVKVYNKVTNTYDALDVNEHYNLAGYNYTLRDLGDGYAMFDGAVNVLDYVMEDYMVLANYVSGFDNGVVGATNSPLAVKYPGFILDYGSVEGSGRIHIAQGADDVAFEDVVWVGGVQVTDANKDDVLGDGGSVKYDPSTDTLTLTDAEIVNEKGHGIYAYGINLTINGIDTDADGSNTITGTPFEESGIDEEGDEYTVTYPGHGVYSEGNGYGGNGGVTITGIIGDVTSKDGSGITAYEDIVISGTVGDITVSGGLECGIESVFGSVIIENTAVMGDVTSAEHNAVAASVDVIIAGKIGNINGNGYAGIHVTGGGAVISGRIDSISGVASGIEAYRKVEMGDDDIWIYSGGDVSISGSVGRISGGYNGIRAEGALLVTGSAEVVATAEDAQPDEACAISVAGNIILPEGRDIISLPVDYQMISVLAEKYDDADGPVELWHNTIADSNGKPALAVEFAGFTNPFADVSASDWYYGDVEYAVVNGLMSGVGETEFAPGLNLTRAMLVTVLYRAEGKPAVNKSIPFADIDMGAYYADAVIWAQQNGIVNGVTEIEFAPDANITREQIAAIMHRYAQYKEYDISVGENTNILSYEDFDSISEYSIASMQYAAGSGMLRGKSESTINPKDNATRAEIAAILHRFVEANK